MTSHSSSIVLEKNIGFKKTQSECSKKVIKRKDRLIDRIEKK